MTTTIENMRASPAVNPRAMAFMINEGKTIFKGWEFMNWISEAISAARETREDFLYEDTRRITDDGGFTAYLETFSLSVDQKAQYCHGGKS